MRSQCFPFLSILAVLLTGCAGEAQRSAEARRYEQQIQRLTDIVERLRRQNADLEERVRYLESCGACPPRIRSKTCKVEGLIRQEGEAWRKGRCEICRCQDGLVLCNADPRCDVKEPECPGGCRNGGICKLVGTKPVCQCEPRFKGNNCEAPQPCPCYEPLELGNPRCNNRQTRYYYNITAQECLSFTYSGCGGNANNFDSFEMCQTSCLMGACCYREVNGRTRQQIQCQVKTLTECKAFHRSSENDYRMYEVVSFKRGLSCEAAQCGSQQCSVGGTQYQSGQRFRLGCQECTCEDTGRVNCRCRESTVRKEIRDLTPLEVQKFQKAVRHLKKTKVWASFRDLYQEYAVHMTGKNFLIWNRIFLRQIEQKLQEIDCSISLPYFEITTNVGAFHNSILWQPNYFGGENSPKCVTDHPFGQDWSPCIRREFNRSRPLPTILDLSLALSSNDFIQMSAKLETSISFVYAYIGGDMVTSHAANDPVFIVMQTYVDMLYWQWQNRMNRENRPTFPARYQSEPIIPFNTEPRYVLNSEDDICVKYVLPSKGHPCNVTSATPIWYPGLVDLSLFSYGGYDRNGFDGRGFNIYGFNREGYDRNGYDTRGYNKQGYNRLGQDRRGRLSPNWREQDGIDRECIGEDGYTTSGFDQYGFSRHGYDVHYCNYSYYGPFATMESFRIWEVLLMQSENFISSQGRTCDELGPVPSVWVEHSWAEGLEKYVGKLPQIQTAKPSSRSERFCIDVSSYPLVCECTEGTVSCPDNPCLTSRCPSNPGAVCQVDICGECKAKWIDQGREVQCQDSTKECVDSNGNPHYPGTKWKESLCRKCECTMDSQLICGRVDCPPLACADPVTMPGHCCPVCLECVYNGKVYLDGAKFQPDPCMSCECRHGQPQCEEVKCPAVFCLDPIHLSGECCATCPNVCKYDNRMIPNNEHFMPSFNPCLNCTCGRGVVRCLNIKCPPPPSGLECSRPVAKNGECCPSICTSCKDAEGREYDDDGSQWAVPENKCQICECRNTKMTCRKRRCAQFCTHGKFDPQTCCPDCSKCHDGDKTCMDGSVFNRTHPEGCESCQCKGGNITCRTFKCPSLNCLQQVTPDDECCPVCAGCMVGGRKYPEDSQVPNPENCRTCTCKYGSVRCESVPCPKPSCSHPARLPGQCCPSCDQCLYGGEKLLRNGESTLDSADPCMQCTCQDGSVTCQNIGNQCNAHCTHPRLVPSQCCPVCDGCMYAANDYLNGQMFRPKPDDTCYLCTCENGNVTCTNEFCQSQCTHPVQVQGTCCPVCGGCQLSNDIYQNGQVFYPRKEDPCTQCTCQDGSVTCKLIACATSCTHPVRVEGVCCPPCDQCYFEGSKYLNGQPFHPDPCRSCTCEHGNVACKTQLCAPACSHPLPKEGECCPACDGCLYENNTYISDQVFHPRPQDPCYTCTCRAGDVSCGIDKCTTKCLHPVIKPDACCPECYGCNYDNIDYLNGQTFKPIADDLCTSCTCANGNVTCKKDECDVSCSNPMRVLGECCPVCDGCEFEGARYRNGHRFRSERDPCDVCECKKGNITCGKQECQIGCKYPMPGQCCPVCDGCHYNGLDLASGQQFKPTSAEDPCQICTCKFGDVTCEKEVCNPRCHHPAPGACCPQCDGCSYMGGVYVNKEKFFPDKEDPCVMCTCNNGTVLCDRQRCQVDCLHPVYLDNYCCPVCDSCDYEGEVWKNGEKFTPKDLKCRSCTCEDGSVTCQSMACERTCSHPKYREDECCPVCDDCSYEGREILNGVEFRARQDDPCRLCTCQDGNVRCAAVECESTCTHPIIDPESCCQTCDNCLYGGQLHRNGVKFNPDDDWCRDCQCFNGSVICEDIQCPPTDCPNPIYRQGVCCAQCPVDCERNGKEYRDGSQWLSPDDQCIKCKCERGTVKCEPRRCPSVTCQEDERLVKPPGSCCEVCVSSKNIACQHKGKEYAPGDTWELDSCTTCRCRQGKVECASQTCPVLQCGHAKSLTVSPGKCCPECVAKPGTCVSYGDPHYQTYDGHTITFQGLCTYVMTKDCVGGDFSVEAKHHDRGTEGAVAWVESLLIRIGGKVVELLQQGYVRVNGANVSLPFTEDPVIHLEGFDQTVVMNTAVGLQVYWNGAGYVEASVPGTYKNRVCGLCGNFNGFRQDDMRMKTGEYTQSPSVLGNSWKVEIPGETCEAATDFDPCQQAGYRVRRYANTKCAILKEPEFVKCHTAVAPDSYYASCIYDMCVCMENSDCLCDILSSYALECAKKGVYLRWRTPTLCAMKCPENAGFVFDECGPACPRLCETRHVPLGNITENCYKPCTPGCKCPANKVLHNDRCIGPEECPDDIIVPS